MYLMQFESYDEGGLFNRMIDINVKGIIYTALEFLPQLRRTRGVVINIASNAGIGTAWEGTTYYAITKAAVIILTKRMAFDLGRYGIRVNAVAPGWIETDMTTANRAPEEVEKTKALVRSRTMLSTLVCLRTSPTWCSSWPAIGLGTLRDRPWWLMAVGLIT